ncbi:ANTAR domain-containing response regulator, partial [Marinobacter sp. F3R11]|uniref:ANTAR domain-containing response regulator n=1 Tax=Marinobacter sp. F3R11 TaxID=2267231 RepID=UPI0011E5E7EC
VVIASHSPRRDTLEHLSGMQSRHPRPMIMLSQEGDPKLTRAAAQAGINAYVVEGLSAPLVQSLIEVTMLVFLNQESMAAELDTSKQTLLDYKTISKAKAHIIRHSNLSEAEAHKQLRRMSQDHRKSIVSIARQVLRDSPKV